MKGAEMVTLHAPLDQSHMAAATAPFTIDVSRSARSSAASCCSAGGRGCRARAGAPTAATARSGAAATS